MKRRLKRFIAFAIILLPVIGTGCAKDIITGKSAYNLYSLKDDVKIGSYVMNLQLKALKKKKKAYDSKKNKEQLVLIKKITKDIAKVSHYPKFPYKAHLADVPVPNAWCAPGGKIMVYEGLWDPKKGLVEKGNKDELAAVLAHEIAHANARHVTEALSRNMTILAVGQVATGVIGAASNVGGNIFQSVFSQGFNVFVPSYSRKNEYEADRVGLIYMAKAGYDPRAAVKLWGRAAKKKGSASSIFATHPPSGLRAKALKKHLPEALAIYEEVVKGRRVTMSQRRE